MIVITLNREPPSELTLKLYASLRVMPCRCEYLRNGLGVPIWSGNPLQRTLTKMCSRHVACNEFEAQYPEYTIHETP